MPEIRFTITDTLNKNILEVAEELGVDKSEYIKSLILQDLREKGVRRNE
jgi:prolyl-tRNA editing enzyme YbaK/EbsC (Cys-tRNA(Pro) deacylase)